jgi:DNA-binding transcriptional LysR family regulator
VLAGLGAAALPRHVVQGDLDRGKLTSLPEGWRIDPERLGDRLYLVTLPNRCPTAARPRRHGR